MKNFYKKQKIDTYLRLIGSQLSILGSQLLKSGRHL